MLGLRKSVEIKSVNDFMIASARFAHIELELYKAVLADPTEFFYLGEDSEEWIILNEIARENPLTDSVANY